MAKPIQRQENLHAIAIHPSLCGNVLPVMGTLLHDGELSFPLWECPSRGGNVLPESGMSLCDRQLFFPYWKRSSHTGNVLPRSVLPATIFFL
ncbi:MAG: hypothetical protein KME13_01340 [Myxacorys californica WJT36-NPBG1]|nr:hypothetical protein [Myxacorys californica WJT36-NPBG1]